MRVADVIAFGSPVYVYDLAKVRDAYDALAAELPENALIYYSLKANPHPVIGAQIRGYGGRSEISSEGELASALEAGYSMEKCLYSGPGKTLNELFVALRAGVRMFSVESARDLRQLNSAASHQGVEVEALLRINPDGAKGNAGLAMTGISSQFGIDENQLDRLPASLSHARVTGIHSYLGSNISELLVSFSTAVESTVRVAKRLQLDLTWLDMGGGFGHPYAVTGNRPQLDGLRNELEAMLDMRFPHWRTGQPRLIFESGRYLVGGCGTLVGTVLDVKKSRGRQYAVLDFGINHLGGMSGLRRIPRVSVTIHNYTQHSKQTEPADTVFVGPLCSPLDVIATVRGVQVVTGDVVSIPNVGAYGLTASLIGFLSRPAPLELVVDGDRIIESSCLSIVRKGDKNYDYPKR
ncbi:MAG: hypothetical protein LBK42_07025 [Propionibacteriaceae bacterium]|jgi:diaminopimelate decarboxylase|nr:hypothetical protein [Propionibacteriaceae bacterium]